ncbi:hypothetical protein ACWDYJ_09585 [Streptomyces sp. NPDC003042]
MGLKDQFHDKAKRLAEQARAQETADEASERSRDARPQADKARETFDDHLDQ